MELRTHLALDQEKLKEEIQQELEELGAQFLLHVNKVNQQISDKVYELKSTWHPKLTSRCMAAACFCLPNLGQLSLEAQREENSGKYSSSLASFTRHKTTTPSLLVLWELLMQLVNKLG